MKNTLTALLLVLICGVVTAQTQTHKQEQTNDAFATFMSKKPQVSFLQQKNVINCETSCFASFRICTTYRPLSVCIREINQCLAPCP